MDKTMYNKIEEYMLSFMTDSAHDSQHVYRVLYQSLAIAEEYDIDRGVLITAALLHDIGREAQFRNPQLDHASVGAGMAYDFLKELGWPEERAKHVRECIATHRYRAENPPISMEAKILYDADKLDVTGLLGISRTLIYIGIESEPLYNIDLEGSVIKMDDEEPHSFFQEYHFKLKNIYDKLFTEKARAIAESRRSAAESFYNSLYSEVVSTHSTGLELLKRELDASGNK
ncbi:MAG: HD domain-containing protein [Thermoclostridium sp.]|nr:HD domain-containing protein [Thermoclostridium sp.]